MNIDNDGVIGILTGKIVYYWSSCKNLSW